MSIKNVLKQMIYKLFGKKNIILFGRKFLIFLNVV